MIKRNQRRTTEDPNQLSYAKIKQLENTKKKKTLHTTKQAFFISPCYVILHFM